MILTGAEIEVQVEEGLIEIKPFLSENVGANSVDLRLADEILYYDFPSTGTLDCRKEPKTKKLKKNVDGSYTLFPNILYLGRTIERLGSSKYVPLVEGRSSIGRLGIQVHMTAGVGDLGFYGTITLEICVVHPIKVYPRSRICQVLWVKSLGEERLYRGRYQGQQEVTPSKMHLLGYPPKGSKK